MSKHKLAILSAITLIIVFAGLVNFNNIQGHLEATNPQTKETISDTVSVIWLIPKTEELTTSKIYTKSISDIFVKNLETGETQLNQDANPYAIGIRGFGNFQTKDEVAMGVRGFGNFDETPLFTINSNPEKVQVIHTVQINPDSLKKAEITITNADTKLSNQEELSIGLNTKTSTLEITPIKLDKLPKGSYSLTIQNLQTAEGETFPTLNYQFEI